MKISKRLGLLDIVLGERLREGGRWHASVLQFVGLGEREDKGVERPRPQHMVLQILGLEGIVVQILDGDAAVRETLRNLGIAEDGEVVRSFRRSSDRHC